MAISFKSAKRWTILSTISWLQSTFPISYAGRIAQQIYPDLWDSARRKLGKNSAVDASFREYVQIRSAQLAQVHVDSLVSAQPRWSGAAANKLILKASQRATTMILTKVKQGAI